MPSGSARSASGIPWHLPPRAAGEEDGLPSSRDAATSHFRARFHNCFVEHAKQVADGHAEEIPKVVAINPNYPDQARKAMAAVASNVAASLREAETKTLQLFP
jgi:hypothetical protein